MFNEESIIERVLVRFAKSTSTPKGDTSWAAYQQGLLSKEQYESVNREHKPSTVNTQEFINI